MCVHVSAEMQTENVVVFLLVSNTQPLVSGGEEHEHPSMDLASLVHITATSSLALSSIFSGLCLRQMLGRFVQV